MKSLDEAKDFQPGDTLLMMSPKYHGLVNVLQVLRIDFDAHFVMIDGTTSHSVRGNFVIMDYNTLDHALEYNKEKQVKTGNWSKFDVTVWISHENVEKIE